MWAAEGLKQRTDRPVDVVTGTALAEAISWEHRIRGDVAEVEIALPEGRRISGARPLAVLNRMNFVSNGANTRLGNDDHAYAMHEYHALFLSWLWALPGPMLNRPCPHFLGGHWRHPAGWEVFAAKAGLPTAAYRQATDDPPEQASAPPAFRDCGEDLEEAERVFVVGGRVVAPDRVPDSTREACQSLAALAGDALLGIDIARSSARPEWHFVTATPLPDLCVGGEPLLDALAGALGLTP